MEESGDQNYSRQPITLTTWDVVAIVAYFITILAVGLSVRKMNKVDLPLVSLLYIFFISGNVETKQKHSQWLFPGWKAYVVFTSESNEHMKSCTESNFLFSFVYL